MYSGKRKAVYYVITNNITKINYLYTLKISEEGKMQILHHVRILIRDVTFEFSIKSNDFVSYLELFIDIIHNIFMLQ